MATAIISLMTDTPIRADVAMTGEVTLSGRVLPVGGIREKALAALNHGVKTVLIPFQNQKDVQDIPEEFRQQLNFVYVEHLDEVLHMALDEKLGKSKRQPTSKGGTGKKGKDSAAASAA
jgi:ATP-dependent Lon protease